MSITPKLSKNGVIREKKKEMKQKLSKKINKFHADLWRSKVALAQRSLVREKSHYIYLLIKMTVP